MKTVLLAVAVLVASISAYAQHGGSAEPRQIKFAPGHTSATVSGTLSNDEEMDYVFSGRKGQTLTITNPKHALFDFRVFSDASSVETEFDSSPTFTMELPEDGDYNFYVRKKRVASPRTARFSITVSIK